jgi:hypothetical protein
MADSKPKQIPKNKAVLELHGVMGPPWEITLESWAGNNDDGEPRFFHTLNCSGATPWGNQLSCEIDPESLLPLSAELGESSGGWLWRLLFDQNSGQVRFMRRSPLTSAISVQKQILFKPCYDPVSALEALRKRIGPGQKSLSIKGTAGEEQFEFQALLDGEEMLEVPAGQFEALRLACQVHILPNGGPPQESGPNSFMLWLTNDEMRMPLKAEAQTPFGLLTILATRIS